jgi:hypothetical protein
LLGSFETLWIFVDLEPVAPVSQCSKCVTGNGRQNPLGYVGFDGFLAGPSRDDAEPCSSCHCFGLVFHPKSSGTLPPPRLPEDHSVVWCSSVDRPGDGFEVEGTNVVPRGFSLMASSGLPRFDEKAQAD